MTVIKAIGFSLCLAIASIAPLKSSNAQSTLPDGPNWQSHVSEEGQFSVRMPGTPLSESRSFPISGEPIDWTVWQSKGDMGRFAVAYSDLTSIDVEAGKEAAIGSLQQYLMDVFDWEPINPTGKPIRNAGYPGREFIGVRNERLAILRLYLAERRLYAVLGASENIEAIGQFLDSFALDSWKTYSFDGGRFSVDFPRLPGEESTIASQVSGKDFTWTAIEARNLTAPEDLYTVAYTDVDGEDVAAGQAELLDRVGANLLKELQFPVVKEAGNSIELDGNPGRSYLGTTDDGGIVAINLYLVGQRLYGVGVRSQQVGNIKQFLGSFQVQ